MQSLPTGVNRADKTYEQMVRWRALALDHCREIEHLRELLQEARGLVMRNRVVGHSVKDDGGIPCPYCSLRERIDAAIPIDTTGVTS